MSVGAILIVIDLEGKHSLPFKQLTVNDAVYHES
jgi:hypothetical protein